MEVIAPGLVKRRDPTVVVFLGFLYIQPELLSHFSHFSEFFKNYLPTVFIEFKGLYYCSSSKNEK